MATTNKKKDDALTNAYTTVAQASEKAKSLTPNQEGIKQLSEYKNLVNQKTSALSSVGQANKQALKYADTQALAQGYATQGAALQNIGNLQNAYLNQVGGINQQYQQQLGALKDTASQNAFTNFEAEASNVVGTAKNEAEMAQGLVSLLDAYGGQMNAEQLGQAQRYIDNVSKQFSQQSVTENGGNKVYQSQSGTNYTSNIQSDEKSGWAGTYKVKVGTKEYKLTLGNKVKDANLDPNSIEVGQITTFKGKDGTYLITKDSKGNIRYTGFGSSPSASLESIAKTYSLGSSSDRSDEKEFINMFYNLNLK